MDLQLIRRDAACARRFLTGAALALCLLLVAAPPSAFAGSVGVDAGGVLGYAGGDEDNVVSITSDGTNYVVTDQAGITANTGCSPGADIYQATCPVASVTTRVVANTGAGNNTIALDSTVTIGARVFGGPGNDSITGGAGADSLGAGGGDDVINSVDGVADQVFCAAGTDRFTVDPIDQLLPDPSTCEDDGIAPGVRITSEPPDLSGSRAASFAFTSGDPNLDHFECAIDGSAPAPCSSPASYDLGDGQHTFAVHGVDRFGHAGTPATSEWTIDVGAPNVNIDSAPSGTIGVDTATFVFSSPDRDLKRFDCRIDGSDWVECESPITLSFLPEGPHTFGIRAVDTMGNVGALTLEFTVALPKGAAVLRRPVSSLVLIAGRTVKVTKRGYAYVALNCSGTKECAGRVLLDTAKKVRSGRRKRVLRLGHARFQIGAARTRRVRIHIPRKKMKLLRKLRKVSTDITVRDLDGSGRARVSSRTIVLKAPPKR